MVDAGRLTSDLRREVVRLERDLHARLDSDAAVGARWRAEHAEATRRSRTGQAYETWIDEQVTQVAVGWALASTFVRFCEDNRLLPQARLAGPGAQLAEARERQREYFAGRPHDSDREYVADAVRQLAAHPATARLVDEHNPMWLMDPSADAVSALLAFWRTQDEATGDVAHDFTDPSLDTRFLGDLYQDLSESARSRYALLQTPHFVEEFILDRTLEPALAERGVAAVTVIDPACGSGHFLLGAFDRLLARRRAVAPGEDVRASVERVLGQVAGVDLNPYASAIAAFRLLVAAMRVCGITRLADVPTWRVAVATGDSLLFGSYAGQSELAGVGAAALAQGEGYVYGYEDAAYADELLLRRYTVVVGNPPYITVKDPALNAAYRQRYSACHRQYALTVPFMQRMFDLAEPGGWVGQITSNSFMKREFGSKLVEAFLPRVDLLDVIDTSGAYIPGHGTPTVIMIGRNRPPVSATVRAVLGVRGEPGQPEDPAKGLVWTAIVDHVDDPSHDGRYVTVTDLPRDRLATHPWSMTGGGAQELLAVLDGTSAALRDRISVIGRTTHTGADDAFFLPSASARTCGVEHDCVPVILGEEVRDFSVSPDFVALFPYDEQGLQRVPASNSLRLLWRSRRVLETQMDFGQTKQQRGLRWIDHSMFFAERYRTPLSIAFAFVATHNHFVLDRGGKVFNRSAPVIKLPEGAGEDEHLRLLGVLNSSLACFWLRQVCHSKGSQSGTGGFMHDEWEEFHEFTGTSLQDFPLPAVLPVERARRLDTLAREAAANTPAAVCTSSGVPTRAALDAARDAHDRIRAEMIAVQEESDWETYRLYGLLDDDLTYPGQDLPGLALGERAFEIALARQVADGTEETQWFARHGSTPITDLPAHWPAAYRDLVQRRLDLIAERTDVALLERPEHKRRWASEPWPKQEQTALSDWLLDRLEDPSLWPADEPMLRSVADLAGTLAADTDTVHVAALLRPDTPLLQVLTDLLADAHVPYLAALRHTDSGLRTRTAWERTWDLQRREDRGETVGPIPVPPKYGQKDYRQAAYWKQRGKLDVPKERFVSYPLAQPDGDPTLLLGWAGYDHLQQARALVGTIQHRREVDGWTADRLTPMLAGVAELLPWVHQWHTDPEPYTGLPPGPAYEAWLAQTLVELGLTRDDLTAWRPPAPARGRRRTR